MSGVRGVRVIPGLGLLLMALALGLGQAGCEGETWECVNDDVSCVQEVPDEASCLQNDYCTFASGCQATACSPLVNDEAACRASGVCDWRSDPMLGPVGCSLAPSWSDCEYPAAESTCVAHAGCNWQPTCVLKPRDCRNIDDQTTCQSRPACKWQQGTGRFQLG